MFSRLALLLITIAAAFGAAPVLEHLYPVGLEIGSTNTLTLQGKFDPWPPQLWTESAGLTFTAQTNKGKFDVVVDAEAAAGPRLIRAYNAEGVSEARILILDDGWVRAETEPNNKVEAAQAVGTLPVALDGRLERNGDVDSYRIDLREGEWLTAEVQCYTVMGKLDPALRLVNTNGVQLAWNHDFATLDPRLVWRAPTTRSVVLQVFGFAYPANSDVQLAGGEGANYRLLLRAESAPPAPPCDQSEREPNNTAAEASEIPIPTQLHGVISPSGDTDRFRIRLQKSEYLEVVVDAASIGSPLDVRLAVEDAASKVIVQTEEGNMSGDARLEWQAPSDGEFFICVRNWQHRGGSEFSYRLRLAKLAADFDASLSVGTLAFTAGTTNDVKVAIKRLRGFTNDLALTLTNLPAGLAAAPAKAPDKDGEVTLKLVAALNAEAFSGPVQVLALSAGETRVVPFALTSRVENNGVPGGYSRLLIEEAPHLWLTVRTNPPAVASK